MDAVADGVVKWNPYVDGYFEDPYPHLHACRDTNPVQPGYNGEWILFRYDHVREVLRSPDFLTADLSGFFCKKEPVIFKNTNQCPFLSRTTSHWLPYLNDSVHKNARLLVENVLARFDMKKVVIDGIQQLFNIHLAGDSLDATLIGATLPVLMFNTMYGGKWSSKEGVAELQRISHSFALSQDVFVPIKTYQEVNKDMQWFVETVMHDFQLNSHEHPLLAYLLEENQKYQLGFSLEEMTSMIGILLLGSIETSQITISTIIYELLKRRSLISYITEVDDISINILAEEFFRFIAPQQYTIRINKKNIELGGRSIPEGSRLFLCLASANRDPAVFPEPDSILLERKNNPHLSFGSGVHACVGSKLARMEMRALLKPLAKAMVEYNIDASVTPQWHRTIFIRGFKELKLVRKVV